MNIMIIFLSALLQSSPPASQQQIDSLLDGAWQPIVKDSFLVNRRGILFLEGIVMGLPIEDCRVSTNVFSNYGENKEVVMIEQHGWSQIGGGNGSRYSIMIGKVAKTFRNDITTVISFRFSVTRPYRSGEEEFSIVKERVLDLTTDSLNILLDRRKDEVIFLH